MINFTFPKEKDVFRAFVRLNDLVRIASYPDTMIGPFEDYCLVKLGITIDGEKEVALAKVLEDWIKKQAYKYYRKDDRGTRFFKVREW